MPSVLTRLRNGLGFGHKARMRELASWQAEWASATKRINARYDAATYGEDLAKYWGNADDFSADKSHMPMVRQRLVKNSRYEMANNGYSDGIGQTYATDLIGVGPSLRMQTASQNYNQLVERTFWAWAKAVKLRQKLWTMAHAKHTDGEAFAIIRRNPKVKHAIKLDLQLVETEQCASPYIMPGEVGKIDGIEFDKFGNPTRYEFLPEHPGSDLYMPFGKTEFVDADQVLHWFKVRRPGQHRGVPECASTLNLGAAFRRGRNAQIGTFEKVAAWTLMLKTMYEPEEIQGAPPMSSFDIAHNMMTTLPNSVEPFQLKAEHPGPQYSSFHKTLLNEQARPKNMPYNKAACDSSEYNYASGRLDHQTYYGSLDTDREDGNDLVLEKLFPIWYDMAVVVYGWLNGDPAKVGDAAKYHIWDWPKHYPADVQTEAEANKTKLQSCQIFLHRLYSDAGMDLEDEFEQAALVFGVDIKDLKRMVLDSMYPKPKANTVGLADATDPASDDAAVALAARILRSRSGSLLNGKQNGHANGHVPVGVVN